MRLTDQQRAIIRATVAETFGAGANVWLFGSRVDDNKRGGDIDLLIKTDQVDVDAIARAEISFLTKIEMKLGEQKIDVLLDYPREAAADMYNILAGIEKKLKIDQPLLELGKALAVAYPKLSPRCK